MTEYTPSQIEAIYHRKFLRIPHGDQHPKKRYIDEDALREMFNGWVHVQEKVDGKLSNTGFYVHDIDASIGTVSLGMEEDMRGKNTCHKHMEYTQLPTDKKISLDRIDITPHDEVIVYDDKYKLRKLDYCVINGTYMTLDQIYEFLEFMSRMPSHFGRDRIEGLVLKNYEKQEYFAKWINQEFEDHLAETNQ
jgi:hypothetical protein